MGGRPWRGRESPCHGYTLSHEESGTCRVGVPYVAWLKALPGKPVFVGYPAGFDFLFVYWYLIRFAGRSPFSFSALDVKSFAMAVLGTEYRATTKRSMPRRWFSPLKHNHVALDDALEQGALFCNMLAEARQRPGLK